MACSSVVIQHNNIRLHADPTVRASPHDSRLRVGVGCTRCICDPEVSPHAANEPRGRSRERPHLASSAMASASSCRRAAMGVALGSWLSQQHVSVLAQQDALCRHWCMGGEFNGGCDDVMCANCVWCASLPPTEDEDEDGERSVCLI